MAKRCRADNPQTWDSPLRPDLLTPHQQALFHGELFFVVGWDDDQRGWIVTWDDGEWIAGPFRSRRDAYEVHATHFVRQLWIALDEERGFR